MSRSTGKHHTHPDADSSSLIDLDEFSSSDVIVTCNGGIAAALLATQEIEKEVHRLSFCCEVMAYCLAVRSDTSPTSRQARFAKQIWLDGHGIEASHVFRAVDPLDIEVIGLNDHAAMIAIGAFPVQREF